MQKAPDIKPKSFIKAAWTGTRITCDFNTWEESQRALQQLEAALAEKMDIVTGDRVNQRQVYARETNQPVGAFIYNEAGSKFITLYSGTSRTYKPLLENIFEKIARDHGGSLQRTISK